MTSILNITIKDHDIDRHHLKICDIYNLLFILLNYIWICTCSIYLGAFASLRHQPTRNAIPDYHVVGSESPVPSPVPCDRSIDLTNSGPLRYTQYNTLNYILDRSCIKHKKKLIEEVNVILVAIYTKKNVTFTKNTRTKNIVFTGIEPVPFTITAKHRHEGTPAHTDAIGTIHQHLKGSSRLTTAGALWIACIWLGLSPPPSNCHHQDYYNFSRGSL